MITIIEIKAAEGGDDAKLLVKNQLSIYTKFCSRQGIKIKSVDHRDGQTTLEVECQKSLFENEIGGHRWQRIPPTERKGRVHTSTITVTVTDGGKPKALKLRPEDVEETFMRGSGKGGQHRNKTSTAVRLKHIPTGETVRCESERSQAANRDIAWKELERRINEKIDDKQSRDASQAKKEQAGSGQRGDKRRTYREQDDIVSDHISGKKSSLEKIMRGEIELLW